MTDAAESSKPGALRRILPALVSASALGYGVQIMAPSLIDASSYVDFSAFWSCLFLGVAALSGIQNEISRSSRVGGTSLAIAPLRRYAWAVGVGGTLLGAAAGGILGVALDSPDLLGLIVAMTIGLGSFALLATVTGTLYGGQRWTSVAVAIVSDPGLRAASFFGLAVSMWAFDVVHVPLGVLLALTVLPFCGAVGIVWGFGGRRAVRSVFIDYTWKELLQNSFHTVTAAVALGFVASGLPLVIAMIGQGEEPSLVAGAILVIVLLRAPLVSPMIALQSYLTVSFRDNPSSALRRSLVLSSLLLLASTLISLVVLVAAPLVGGLLAPRYALPTAWTLVIAVFASGLVGVQLIAGAAVLARGSYPLYVAGWLTTAIGVVAFAFIPLPFELRLAVLLVVPVIAGLSVHAGGLVLSGTGRATAV